MAVTLSEEPVEAPRIESIEELFLGLEGPLLGYARRMLPEFNVAEDIVQEAFVRLHAQGAAVRTPRSWLYRTVHNLAMNHRRNSSKIIPMTPQGDDLGGGDDLPDPALRPDEQYARDEGAGLVRESLKNLDARSQELIRLRFTENLSYKQISERTGLSVGNVGYLLHHTLKSLAAGLAHAGLFS